MAFGFGGNRSSSTQQSTAGSRNQSSSGNLGYNESSYGQGSSSNPWEGQQPYLLSQYERANQLYNRGPNQFYPDSTVNPLNPYQQQAIDARFQRGAAGSPTEQALGDTLLRSLQGGGPDTGGASAALGQFNAPAASGLGYLQGQLGGGVNPYVDQAFDRASQRLSNTFNENVLPGVNATFGGAGRTGSPAHERTVDQANRTFGESQADLAAQIYAPAYEADQNRRQQGAAQLAGLGLAGAQSQGALGVQGFDASTRRQLGAGALVPALSGLDVQNLNLQQQSGDLLRGQSDAELQDLISRYYYNQDAPYQQLQRYQQGLGPALTESQSSGGGSSFGYTLGGSQATGSSESQSSGRSNSSGFNFGFSK